MTTKCYALAITALMVVLIMMDKLPFGAPPLLACLLLVIFGIADIKAAFGGFSNATIVMLAEFWQSSQLFRKQALSLISRRPCLRSPTRAESRLTC